MIRSNMTVAALAVMGFTGAAAAQLTGTSLDITQAFTGTFATTTTGPHVYGGPPTIYPDPGFPAFTWTASSPAAPPPAGFDNSIFCDYGLFALTDFAGTITTLTVAGIDVNVATNSARIINSAGTQIGIGTSGGSNINFTWNVDDVLAGPTPTMTIAWDNAGVVCYPDCNLDTFLTVADFGCFQTAFIQNLPYAECNGDTFHTVADFGCFQTKFIQGCPP